MGGGEARNIEFKSGEQTNFTFPFALAYRAADDPGSAVFADLGQKCGFGDSRRQNIVINYKLTVGALSSMTFVQIRLTFPSLELKF